MADQQALVDELFANCTRACRYRDAAADCTCAKIKEAFDGMDALIAKPCAHVFDDDRCSKCGGVA